VRIAVLAHCYHPVAEPFCGGLEMHTAVVANELAARGHQVVLFAKEGSRSRARVRAILDASYRYGLMPDAAGVDQSEAIAEAATAAAVRRIEVGRFDAVLNNSLSAVPFTALPDAAMLTILHTPADLVRVNAVIESPGWRPGPRHAYAAVSAFTAEDWRTRLPAVACIPNGVDLRRWRPAGTQRPEPDLAVWAARITPEKGLPLAIRACRIAGLRLEIAGPIAHRDHFESDIAPLLGRTARYVGHLTHAELPTFLRRGRIFVSSPRWSEPFGLALVEAMACGTPAAALPRGAAAEVVSPTGGVLAADSSAVALAAAIRQATTLDRAAVRASVLRFDHLRMVTAYEQALAGLATAPAPAAGEPVADVLAR
jgi:glycosyltransferase involved in cell wall biosynthesis